jgi:RNA polymerase sigma-70 factor (ECF subfamily)
MHIVPNGVSETLESTVDRFAGLIRQVGWRHRLSESDIDEVMQEVRIRLWRAQGKGEHGPGVGASYVYRTAMSAAVDLLRRRRARRADVTVPVEDAFGAADPAASPEQSLAATELGRQVEQAIETIHPTRRPVVRMYLAGHPREEIADLMGWSEGKTRNLLYRGLADLRARLTEMGIGLEGRE